MAEMCGVRYTGAPEKFVGDTGERMEAGRLS